MKLSMKYLGLLLVSGLFLCFGPDRGKVTAKIRLAIPEPSDVCANGKGTGYFVVSDNGYLFEIDLSGKVLRKAEFEGTDFEACYLKGDSLWVVDELTRFVHFFNPTTLVKTGTREVSYNGGRNRGFEALCFNPVLNKWMVFTEKDPTWAFTLEGNLEISNRNKIKGLPDLSSATFHDGKVWLLSDEAHTLYQCDPVNLKIEKEWSVPIINPEGLVFSPEGNVLVLSDDMATLFTIQLNP